MEVGNNLKTPFLPIWVICKEYHSVNNIKLPYICDHQLCNECYDEYKIINNTCCVCFKQTK